MKKKKLLIIHLNEFNLSFLKKGAHKFNCKNINKILNYKRIQTYSVDKTQDKDLDPWTQSVSINSGIRSKKHKIFNLGQKIPKKLPQIWDILSKKKINCAVWGAMNSTYINNKSIKIFFPDPWNDKVILKPKNLKKIFTLPQVYAQNYSDFKIFKNFNAIYSFFIAIISSGILTYFIKNFFLYLRLFISSRFKNYFLFFLFDIISIHFFKNLTKKYELNFSLIFLNSLAHFQHNNWDEKKNFHKYFLLTEEICKCINQLSLRYDDVLIYNGFTQKKIKTEFIIRPKNPRMYLKEIGVKFKNFSPNMTNGGIIYFNNTRQKKLSLKKLKNANIYGLQLFDIINLDTKSIFFRIQIKSFSNFNSINNKKINIRKVLSQLVSEKKNRNFKKINLDNNLDKFTKNMVFIKTTGRHHHEGHLLMKNKLTNKNRIENKDIFLLLKKYF
tara:strand:- start:783 stop:2108 length:1326 start_codon:yes stop_codon:yes gene_type:complete